MTNTTTRDGATRPRVVVVGAHTAIAAALDEALDTHELDVDLVRTSPLEHVGEGVVPLGRPVLEGANVILWLDDDPAARALAADPRAALVPNLDLVGLRAGAPIVFPRLDARPEGGRMFPGAAQPAHAVLTALAPLGPWASAELTVLASAATFGKPGLDKLSDQVRAVFNLADVDPAPFGANLAFNLLPAPPADDAALGAALGGALGAPVHLTRVVAPTFSAELALLQLRARGPIARAAVEAAVAGAKGVRLEREAPPAAQDALGRDDALVFVADVSGDRVSLWMALDHLGAGSAAVIAVFLERLTAAAPAE